MKHKARNITVTIVIFAITLFVLFQGAVMLYALVPWTVPWVGNIIIANPSTPNVKYGEFPFALTYEIDGTLKVIEDTIICEFKGFELHGTAGKYRKWESKLKSGNKRITILNVGNLEIIDNWGNQVLEVYFDPGNAEYYMGDSLNDRQRKGEITNSITYTYQKENGDIGFSAISANEAYEKYKIRLISWEPSPPIKNSFR